MGDAGPPRLALISIIAWDTIMTLFIPFNEPVPSVTPSDGGRGVRGLQA